MIRFAIFAHNSREAAEKRYRFTFVLAEGHPFDRLRQNPIQTQSRRDG